jgi:hypothetical protein
MRQAGWSEEEIAAEIKAKERRRIQDASTSSSNVKLRPSAMSPWKAAARVRMST